MKTLNTYAKVLRGARLLTELEVPQAGDYCKWSQSQRDEWIEIKTGNTFRTGLPVATLRHRCGQPELQFCTYSK